MTESTKATGFCESKKLRIGLIGAGPCGLSQLHAFVNAHGKELSDESYSIVCFDKQSQWGGQWNDEIMARFSLTGEPAHSAMYKDLWTNEPKECMEYADYSFLQHFGKPTPSFPSREVIFHYMEGRAIKSGLHQFIRFNQAVRWLSFDDKSSRFVMHVEDLTTNDTSRHEFDYVIVATGHFSCPNVPYFEGLETFEGLVLHAHDFRDAEIYRGMDVLLVGASYSAEDIALQSMKFGASSVTISCRSEPLQFQWLPGVDERALIERISGKRVYFTDGTEGEVRRLICHTFTAILPIKLI
jgi:trimethylamine monooxygenase